MTIKTDKTDVATSEKNVLELAEDVKHPKLLLPCLL